MKNEINSDYYYLSNRKTILSKLADLIFRESLISAQRFVDSDALKQQYGSFTEDKDKAGSAKVINLGM